MSGAPEEAPWDPRAFEHRYRAESDPWEFASSPYERERFRATLRALSRERYERAFEAGCSIGELTRLLAPRCGELLATDVSPTALRRARARCAAFPHVTFEEADLRSSLPAHRCDLIVLGEVGYYFTEAELRAIVRRLVARLEAGGELLAVHWLGSSADHRLHGDDVHRIVADNPRLALELSRRFEGFRLDRWCAP